MAVITVDRLVISVTLHDMEFSTRCQWGDMKTLGRIRICKCMTGSGFTSEHRIANCFVLLTPVQVTGEIA